MFISLAIKCRSDYIKTKAPEPDLTKCSEGRASRRTARIIILPLFELTEDLRVVDLTRLPAEPSMFDPELGWLRREIRFLHMFVKQLSGHVETDHEDIEYVPTQIVSEYLLHVPDGGERVRGLIYQSSIAQGACVALDIRNDHCIGPETAAESDSPHLRLVADNIRSAARRRCGTSRQESSHHVETLDSIKSI